ncbi:MAG: Bax inhibitor-1 family protein [Arenicellales bacterium WSBS_2016_MAG_OTU3]
MNNSQVTTARAPGELATNKVLKNTYIMLAATLGFSAVTATISIMITAPIWTYIASLVAGMVLGIFVLPKVAHKTSGVGWLFLITGLLGFGLGAVLSIYLSIPKGPQIIGTAFGGTAVIFLGLSAYALKSGRDFSFMGGFLFAGMMAIVIAIIANIFLQMPMLSIVISVVVIMIMAGFILFDTSRIINGGETNYIIATYGIYLSIFSIFIHLLSLLGIVGGDE